MRKKLSLEKFMAKARLKHGDKYDYSRVCYKCSFDKIIIICPMHGAFTQGLKNHLRGNGCKFCVYDCLKLSKETFIFKSNIIHNNKYKYEINEFCGSNNSVINIVCPIHGNFTQSAKNHLSGKGCRNCADDKLSDDRRKPLGQFISEANEIHNCKYSYNKVEYINCKTKIVIECPIHGDFKQTPYHHLLGKGCQVCGRAKIIYKYSKKSNLSDKFIEKARLKHGDKYDYSEIKYINSKSKIIIKCRVHGDFNQRPSDHIRSVTGCKKCSHELLAIKRNGKNNPVWNSDREYVNLRKNISVRCKNLLRRCLKTLGMKKSDRTHDILGYTRMDLYNHFVNYPGFDLIRDFDWHIDHIFPVKAFVEHGIVDLKIINSLDNLRPLLKNDNLSKNCYYDEKDFFDYLLNKVLRMRRFVEKMDTEGIRLKKIC